VVLQSALIVLVGLSPLTGVDWPDPFAGALVVVGVVLIVAGFALLAFAGVSLLDARSATVFPRPREGAAVAERGAYRLVRHPVYGAVLLLALGVSLTTSPLGLIPTVLLAVVFDLKARVEEAWLGERLPGYAGYRERTQRRFVPGVY
jgi:protein-S-isoprenylcysteine O-methyltransferase Ste14